MVRKAELSEFVAPAIDEVLSPRGFVRSKDGVWRCSSPPWIGCVELQTRSDRSAFTVNLGVHFDFIPVAGTEGAPPLDIREPQCELRTRLEERGREKWWTSPKRDAAEVAELMRGQGLDFLTRYQDPRTVFGELTPSEIEGEPALALTPQLTRSRRLLLFARVYEYIGRLDWAKEVAESALAERLPVGPRVQLKRLLARLQGADTTEG